MTNPARQRKNQTAEKEDRGEGQTSKGVSELLSGKMGEAATRRKKTRKHQKPVELLPDPLRPLADIFAAGKVVDREIRTKISISEQRIKDYCLRRFCQNFAATGHRPTSTVFAGNKSRFTFIQTRKTYLSPEKADAIRMMNVPIDDYTELGGIEVDYEAIREHHLESKLREALSQMDVPEEVLNECFRPKVVLKDTFVDMLSSVVEKSLQPDEKLPEKMYEMMKVLGVVNQVKSPEIHGLKPQDCFQLVMDSEVPAPEGFGEDESD